MACFVVLMPFASAQHKNEKEVRGYITAVDPPGGFDVNGEHITLRPETRFGLIGDMEKSGDAPLRDEARVGAYVWVVGVRDKAAKTMIANTVLLRDDWKKKLSGMGLIDKVISNGPEPVFRADGYLIRITGLTDAKFRGALKTLADVRTNTWLAYEGKRDATGVLVASKVTFIPDKPPKARASQPTGLQDKAPNTDSIIDADGHFESARAKVRMSAAGGWCGWHKVPADPALQERVWRLGMSVVPAYMKQLRADDPAKIHFRFYAIDERKIRADIVCNEGLILIPKQIVARLKNDDQLTALLADGVAYNLQMHSALLAKEFLEAFGGELAGYVAGFFVPGVDIATDIGTDVAVHKIEVQMEEQRGRVALALMADAGQDPRQAPEAWRLLAPKNLPKDAAKLKYPSRSGYQLGILNLQYRDKAAGVITGAVPTVSAGK